MMKNSTYKFLTKILGILILCFCCMQANCDAAEKQFVSLSPALTEIMYAIGAEHQLMGVSTSCNYPESAKNKEIVGDSFYVNKEKILHLSPDYVLAVEGVQSKTCHFERDGIKTVTFNTDSVNSVYEAVLQTGMLAGKTENAIRLVKDIAGYIDKNTVQNPKKILYIIQLNPIITIGNKSFIADLIRKSGNTSVTDGLNLLYPQVTYEYISTLKPDVILICYKSDDKILKKLFPNIKIIYLSQEQNDFINRPGPRIKKAVEFFRNL